MVTENDTNNPGFTDVVRAAAALATAPLKENPITGVIEAIESKLPENQLKTAMDKSVVSGVGGVSYEEMLRGKAPKANYLADPNKINDVEEGKWTALYNRATLQANTDIEGGLAWLYEAVAKDPNYIPLKDPQFTSLPVADQILMANQVKDAAHPDMMRGYIKAAEKNKMIREEAERLAGGGWNVTADLVGSLFNASNLITFRRAAIGASVAARIGIASAEAGSATLLSELGRQKIDPMVQDDEVALNSLMGVAVGGFLGGLGAMGSGLSPNAAQNLQKLLSGQGDPLPRLLKDTGSDSAGAQRAPETDDGALAVTNSVFDYASKALNIGQEQDGLRSVSRTMNQLTTWFTSHIFLLKGNLKGQATSQSVLNVSDAQFNYRIQPMQDEFDNAYTAYKSEGGTLNEKGFQAEVRQGLLHPEQIKGKGISQGVTAVRNYLKNIADDLKRVDPEFQARDNYYPQVLDHNIIRDNQFEFKKDLERELLEIVRKEELKYLNREVPEVKIEDRIPTNPEDPKFKQYVNAMYEKLVYNSRGLYHRTGKDKTWSNHHLEKRIVDLSSSFVEKYGSSDLMQVLKSYGHKSSKSYALLKETGMRDPYEAVSRLADDYMEMERKLRSREALSPEAEVNLRNTLAAQGMDSAAIDAHIGMLRKNELTTDQLNGALYDLGKSFELDNKNLNTILDLFTHNNMADVSDLVRNSVALAKAHTYLSLMGSVILSMIPDTTQVAKKSIQAAGMDTEIVKLANQTNATVKLLDKKSVRLFGILSDKLTGASRTAMWADLPELDVLTKVEKWTRKATQWFSKANLMDPINNLTRAMVGEDVASILLGHADDIVKGKLDPNSAIAIELNKLGLSRKIAADILDNFTRFKDVEDGVVMSGIRNWDAETAIDMIALVQRAVNNSIIVPTNGSRPSAANGPLGSLVFSLKGFLMTSVNKLLLPSLQNLSGVNPKIAVATLATIATDLALASIVGVVQSIARGQEPDMSPEAILNNVLTKNSTFAILGLGNDAAGLFGYSSRDWLGINSHNPKNPSTTAYQKISSGIGLAAGPFARSIVDAGYYGSMYASATTPKAEEANLKRLVKLIPGNNLLYWNWALQAPQKKH